MKCICGPGRRLSPGDKLALLLIGDLVRDGLDKYWEAQRSLAERMGTTPRSAGRAVRSLTEAGALSFVQWHRVASGATVKVFAYTPENVELEVGETFPPDIGETFPPQTNVSDEQVGRNARPGLKFLTTTSEETVIDIGETFLQTGTEPLQEQKQNRHKVAIQRSHNKETQQATA
jgi:hypothetical protein